MLGVADGLADATARARLARPRRRRGGRRIRRRATRGVPLDARPQRSSCPPQRGLADAQAARFGLPSCGHAQTASRCPPGAPRPVRRGEQRAGEHHGGASELSDDGSMLRNISAIVALLELEERASIEQAIVGYAAARGEFPPGAFKALVTTTTEEASTIRRFAPAHPTTWAALRGGAPARRPARELLDTFLRSTEDAVSLEASAWSAAEGGALAICVPSSDFSSTASARPRRQGRRPARTDRSSLGVPSRSSCCRCRWRSSSAGACKRSVGALTEAAERVRSSSDFSVRARRASNDELGMLTETFNEMLAGMQSRDAELEQHRSHLERLVVARTQELGARNSAMRLVLDNVEQGLATVRRRRLAPLRALRGLRRWSVGARRGADGGLLRGAAAGDERLRLLLKLGWEQVVEVSCRRRSPSSRCRSASTSGAATSR